MPDFGELADKAKDLAGEHADKIEEVAEKAGDFLGDKIGHQDQIDSAVDKLKEAIPGGE